MNMKSLLMSFLITVPALLLNPVLANQTSPAAVKAPVGETASKNKLSINTATVEQLEAIPGIGQKKAEAILAHIKTKGPIKDQQQLMEVKGIGSKLAAKIVDFVSF